MHVEKNHHCMGSWRPAVGLPLAINEGRGGARAGLAAEVGARRRRKGRRRAGSQRRNNCVQLWVRLAAPLSTRAVVETPTSSQPPRGAQGRRLLGPVALRTCPFASLLGQVRARLGPGGYCRRSGNGGPQTCLPAAHGVALQAGQYVPSSPTSIQDPHDADDARPPQERPH